MDVRIIPFDENYLDEALSMMRTWSPDHPELGEKSLYDWQRCSRYLALNGTRVVGHIGQVSQEFRHADGSKPVTIGWGITLVLDASEDAIRKSAGRQLLKACEDAHGMRYGAVGVVPGIEAAYLRRGHRLDRTANRYYARFLNPSKALKYWRKSAALTPLVRIANLVHRPRMRVRFGSLEAITHFRPEWDATWDDLLKQRYNLYAKRDAEFLNYKLSQPHRTYHSYVHRNTAGELQGYVIYRRARHLVKDMDLVKVCDFVGTSDAMVDMFSEVMRFAFREAKTTYGVVGLSSVLDEKEFKSVGMYVARSYPVVLAADVEGPVRVDFFDSDLDDLW